MGALVALLNMEFEVFHQLMSEQFKGKDKLIAPNIHALELGFNYAKKHYDCPSTIQVARQNNVGNKKP